MKTPFEVVALSGKSGSGKDYLAKSVFGDLGYKQFSLAWHKKVELVGRGALTHDDAFVIKDFYAREMIKYEHNELGRHVHGLAVWVNTAVEWMRLLHETYGIEKFVIADIRRPDEMDALKALVPDVKVFRVSAPLRESFSPLTPEQKIHETETALDHYTGFDGIIFNDPDYEGTQIQQITDLLNNEHEEVLENVDVFDNMIDSIRARLANRA
jgi:hypothetical protein